MTLNTLIKNVIILLHTLSYRFVEKMNLFFSCDANTYYVYGVEPANSLSDTFWKQTTEFILLSGDRIGLNPRMEI